MILQQIKNNLYTRWQSYLFNIVLNLLPCIFSPNPCVNWCSLQLSSFIKHQFTTKIVNNCSTKTNKSWHKALIFIIQFGLNNSYKRLNCVPIAYINRQHCCLPFRCHQQFLLVQKAWAGATLPLGALCTTLVACSGSGGNTNKF